MGSVKAGGQQEEVLCVGRTPSYAKQENRAAQPDDGHCKGGQALGAHYFGFVMPEVFSVRLRWRFTKEGAVKKTV